MASSRALLALLLILAFSFSSARCRKVLIIHEGVYVHPLHEEPAATTTPSKRGQAFIMNENLVDQQLKSISRRHDQSVPSPGDGHGH
ncbi:hypothetical protein DCAR_0104246 [Daucus carota subsp. sativus]|uniref:Uncharacterized protein n=1 Tax=Daucus carota subsp. sativus TaxID=79200 RepID=A0A166INW7_DAUCS|nr:hypothetical protein DCAR_0104246 [Daucus carota subsp. sativus]